MTKIHFKFTVSPAVTATTTLVMSPVNAKGKLQCTVEAFPKPLNGWYKSEGIKLPIKHFSNIFAYLSPKLFKDQNYTTAKNTP